MKAGLGVPRLHCILARDRFTLFRGGANLSLGPMMPYVRVINLIAGCENMASSITSTDNVY
jgi:hypothetical protein